MHPAYYACNAYLPPLGRLAAPTLVVHPAVGIALCPRAAQVQVPVGRRVRHIPEVNSQQAAILVRVQVGHGLALRGDVVVGQVGGCPINYEEEPEQLVAALQSSQVGRVSRGRQNLVAALQEPGELEAASQLGLR